MATVEEPVGRLDEGSDRRVCKLHIGCGTHYINGFNMLQSQTPTELEWNLFRQFVRTETSTCFRFLDTGYTTLQRFTDGEIPGRSSNWRCFSQKPPWKKRISQLSHLWPAIHDLIMVNPHGMASWHHFWPWHQARQERSQVSATLKKVEKLVQELQDWAGGDRISSPNCHTRDPPIFIGINPVQGKRDDGMTIPIHTPYTMRDTQTLHFSLPRKHSFCLWGTPYCTSPFVVIVD